jgi:hypothetical protein
VLNCSRSKITKLRQLISIVVTSLAIVAGIASSGNALVISTRLQQVLEESSVIATGRCIGIEADKQRYHIDIRKVLKGKIPLGKQLFSYVSGRTPSVRSPSCIVFINSQRQLQFIAVPITSPDEPQPQELGRNLLIVFGDNLNFRSVSPHFITLSQLEDYIKTGKLIYKFKGQIPLFSKELGEIVPAVTRIRAEYELFSGEATVQESPTVAGLPSPTIAVFKPKEIRSDVSLNYSAVGNEKQLLLVGNVNGIDQSTGELLVDFVTEPLLYAESDFQNYLTNPKFGKPQYNISVMLDSGEKWSLRMSDRNGSNIGTLLGFRNQSFSIPYGLSTNDPHIRIAPASTIDENSSQTEGRFRDEIEVPLNGDGTMFLAIDPSTLSQTTSNKVRQFLAMFPGRRIFSIPLRGDRLLETLVQKPIDCMVRIEGGRQPMQPTPCRLNLDRVDFKPI